MIQSIPNPSSLCDSADPSVTPSPLCSLCHSVISCMMPCSKVVQTLWIGLLQMHQGWFIREQHRVVIPTREGHQMRHEDKGANGEHYRKQVQVLCVCVCVCRPNYQNSHKGVMNYSSEAACRQLFSIQFQLFELFLLFWPGRRLLTFISVLHLNRPTFIFTCRCQSAAIVCRPVHFCTRCNGEFHQNIIFWETDFWKSSHVCFYFHVCCCLSSSSLLYPPLLNQTVFIWFTGLHMHTMWEFEGVLTGSSVSLYEL